MQRTTQRGSKRPGGFTLLEILVVITIIAALIAISVAVYGNMMESAREAATRATIAKVEALLQQQVTAWNREFEGSNAVKQEVVSPQYLLVPPRNYSFCSTPQQAEVAALKAIFRAHFPQRDVEAVFGSAYSGWSADGNDADSSELLYLTLTQGKFRGATPVDEDSFTGRELADTDGDTFPELVDAWGKPLRFYRWPTRLLNLFDTPNPLLTTTSDILTTPAPGTLETIDVSNGMVIQPALTAAGSAKVYVIVGQELMQVDSTSANSLDVFRGSLSTAPAKHGAGAIVKLAPFPNLVSLAFGSLNTAAALHDPDDPQGILLGCNVASFEQEFHTLDSFHTPLIVSAGSDGDFGLEDPADTASFGHLAMPIGGTSIIANPGDTALNDNITNLSGGN